jgi:Ni/Co efflux regulator RcnB
MKNLLFATVALSLLFAPAAFAQSDRSDRNRAYVPPAQSESYDHRAIEARASDRGNSAAHREDNSHRESERHWNKGERLPREFFRDRQYTVSDYGRYELRKPPRGYHWVTAYNRYFLVGTQTGTIIDIQIGR